MEHKGSREEKRREENGKDEERREENKKRKETEKMIRKLEEKKKRRGRKRRERRIHIIMWMNIWIMDDWVMTPCILVTIVFGELCSIHLHSSGYLS
jgi:hypothetical protein